MPHEKYDVSKKCPQIGALGSISQLCTPSVAESITKFICRQIHLLSVADLLLPPQVTEIMSLNSICGYITNSDSDADSDRDYISPDKEEFVGERSFEHPETPSLSSENIPTSSTIASNQQTLEEAEQRKNGHSSAQKGSSSTGGHPTNFLQADEDSDDENSSDDANSSDDDGINAACSTGLLEEPVLPSASTVLSKNRSVATSVFRSEYEHSEAASQAILEKHVKITDAVKEPGKDGGHRGPCRAFRKGACFRGNKCRFSHVLPGGRLANEAHKNPPSPVGSTTGYRRIPAEPATVSEVTEFKSKAIDYNQYGEEEPQRKRKKKFGVTNSLLPPKKYRQIFDQQSAKEKPWMAE